jgi:hypothetical protein
MNRYDHINKQLSRFSEIPCLVNISSSPANVLYNKAFLPVLDEFRFSKYLRIGVQNVQSSCANLV